MMYADGTKWYTSGIPCQGFFDRTQAGAHFKVALPEQLLQGRVLHPVLDGELVISDPIKGQHIHLAGMTRLGSHMAMPGI